MGDISQKIYSKLSLRAIGVLKDHSNTHDETMLSVEKLRIDFEADKIEQINTELQLKIENEKRKITELKKIDQDLQERLESLKALPLNDTKADVDLNKKRLEELLKAGGGIQNDKQFDVCLLEDLHKDIERLKKENKKLNEKLQEFEDLPPDLDLAKEKVKSLALEVKSLEDMRARNLESDITKCVSSMFQSKSAI